MRIVVVLLVLLVACGKAETKPEAPPPPAAAGSVANLKVTVDGAPLAADRAFVRRVTTDVYTVLVGAGEGSCESLRAGAEETTGKALSFTVAKRVAPTGHESFVVTDVWSRDFAIEGAALPQKAKLEGSADEGASMTLELSVSAGAFAMAGTLVAAGCGDGLAPAGLGVPKVPHEMTARIVVAGKPLPIRGVIVSAREGVEATDLPNITISTNLKDCSAVTLAAPVILARADGAWSLRGTWFDAPIEGNADATQELTFSANSVGQSADGPTLVLQLSGSGKFGDYTVKLGGTAEAIECVR